MKKSYVLKTQEEFDVRSIPHCANCDKPNEGWMRLANEMVKRHRRCAHCGKLSTVWFYKVYVVGPYFGKTKGVNS